MRKKPDRKASKPKTLRVEGIAPVSRLQELLQREPKLKLEIVMPRAAPGRAGSQGT
jgi:hypothetical protein